MSNQSQPLRRSSRLASKIPASHWLKLGYTEVTSKAFEKLQNDLERFGGAENAFIEADPGIGHLTILPHHELVIPHWKKFANGLKECETVRNLSFLSLEMPHSLMEVVFPAFDRLKHLHLGNLGLDSSCFQYLSSFLGENRNLERFTLFAESFEDHSIALSFSDAIKKNTTLKKISFIMCDLDSNIDIFREILDGCQGIENIFFQHESFGDEEIALISDFISSNHPVESLTLRQTNITDSRAYCLASALESNTNLAHLDLIKNDISSEGRERITSVLFDTTSMDSVVNSSNHTCFVLACGDGRDIQSTISEMTNMEAELMRINGTDDSTGKIIRKKVVLHLCGLYSYGTLFDLCHFNELALQHMPRILELVQEHSVHMNLYYSGNFLKKYALSRLFHTLRAWKLPLLFENLQSPSSTGVMTRKRKRSIYR